MARIIIEIPIRQNEVVVDGERKTLNRIAPGFWVVREDGIPDPQYTTNPFKERLITGGMTGEDTEIYVRLVNIPYSQDGQGDNGVDVTHDHFQSF